VSADSNAEARHSLTAVQRGDALIRFDLAATALFALTAAYAAAVFSTPAQWVGAVTAMALFAIGVFAFLWSYWNAVQRSREVDIAVSQLYLLMGPAIPSTVRRVMDITLIAQFAIAAVTTISRPNGPEGNPGSSLAVGFLVPMLGFGLNGLWAVRHGQFATRVGEYTQSDGDLGQNAGHG
jgi:nitrogen fixation-related uncharacterized protein